MFTALDKTTVVAAKDIEAKNLALITNMLIDDKFFDRHSTFFASIGYIALQIAQIEDEIRQSMIAMTGDFGAVDDQTKGKNLGVYRRTKIGQRGECNHAAAVTANA